MRCDAKLFLQDLGALFYLPELFFRWDLAEPGMVVAVSADGKTLTITDIDEETS